MGSLVPLVIGVGLSLLLHFVIGPKVGDFYTKILLDIGINIILAVSLNIVNGFTGQFSIGHAGFMAVGGYTAAAITYYTSMRVWGSADAHGGFLGVGEWLFVGSCIAGGCVAALAGFLVGLPSLRLRGDYLAIVTLGFGEIFRVLLNQTGDVLFLADEVRETPIWKLPVKVGGSLGFTGLPFYTSLFWVFIFTSITVLAAYRLKESSLGRAFLSIREDEVAAEAMGIKTTRVKVTAFVIAAFFAGIAGGLFGHELGVTLNPQDLGFQKSFDIVIMVVLGGMGSISGTTLAAILLTILPEVLRSLAGPTVSFIQIFTTLTPETADYIQQLVSNNLRMIVYALALILMMILRPQGLFGLGEIWRLRRAKPLKPEVAA